MTPLCPGRCRPCSAAVWAVLVVASLGGGGTPWALSFRPTPSIPLRIGRCDKLFVRTNRSVERSLGGWEAEEEAGELLQLDAQLADRGVSVSWPK